MKHLMKYSLLESLRTKEVMFWSILFPMLLATLFRISFGTGTESTEMKAIPVAAYIGSEAKDDNFRPFLDELDGTILKVSYLSKDAALDALKTGEIKGIFSSEENLALDVAGNGIEESILKMLLETYEVNSKIMGDIGKKYPANMGKVLEGLETNQDMTQSVSLGGKAINQDIECYFALIAMTCLYGGFLGVTKAENLLANVSKLGARRSVSSVNKFNQILTNMITAFFIHFINVCVLLLYMKVVLKVPLEGELGGILLICLFGTLLGVSFGMLLGSISKLSGGMRVGLLIGISMISSTCAGLMVNGVRGIIEEYMPLINRINPSALISDAFYCLTVYQEPARFYRNLLTLGCMSAVMVGICFWMMRRERYDSI